MWPEYALEAWETVEVSGDEAPWKTPPPFSPVRRLGPDIDLMT